MAVGAPAVYDKDGHKLRAEVGPALPGAVRLWPYQRDHWSCCHRAIAFVGPAHDDPERIVRQWPLQRLRLTLTRYLQIADH